MEFRKSLLIVAIALIEVDCDGRRYNRGRAAGGCCLLLGAACYVLLRRKERREENAKKLLKSRISTQTDVNEQEDQSRRSMISSIILSTLSLMNTLL